MNPASGLNVRAVANSDVPTQSRLKAAIAIKMNSIFDPHSTTSRISRNQNPITKIHMLSHAETLMRNDHIRGDKSFLI
jgi:hypothetical protein